MKVAVPVARRDCHSDRRLRVDSHHAPGLVVVASDAFGWVVVSVTRDIIQEGSR